MKSRYEQAAKMIEEQLEVERDSAVAAEARKLLMLLKELIASARQAKPPPSDAV